MKACEVGVIKSPAVITGRMLLKLVCRAETVNVKDSEYMRNKKPADFRSLERGLF